MDNIIVQNTGEDNVKRLKIILLSFVISFSLFFTKIFAQQDAIWKVYLVGGIYFIASFIGLLWALNFKVKFKSLIYIFQGSLFVLSEVFFVLLFFFHSFNRIYEGLLLILLLLFIWIITYACFLMVNVFNVAVFKKIPLLQVAQTASYILSLLMVYFLTFSVLASELQLYIVFPLIFVVYLFIYYMQFNELGMDTVLIWRRVVIISLINMFLLVPLVFVGSNHELISILPTVGGFVGGGLLNLDNQKDIKWQIIGYNIILFIAVAIIVYLNWF
jgi:hypothetical protein